MAANSHETCPYRGLPDERYWRKAVAGVPADMLQPMRTPKFAIQEQDKVATAGSCFAQHLSKYLVSCGYNYLVTEASHPVVSDAIARNYNYGTFSARFGNIYTTRQLLQLIRRAYGQFTPLEDCWEEGGRYFDPFRPLIQPEGFASRAEFDADREQHLAAVRRMIEQADVFIFTLGLTETWEDIRDGAVFPVCPGCGHGTFSDEKFRFLNMRAAECADDLNTALEMIMARNPAIRVVLTVSPVPLIATAEPDHVLTATTYSKAALRVAANEVASRFANVEYFPSYEIITGSYARGRYFAEDLREVRPEGVQHVMRCFSQSFLGDTTAFEAKANALPSQPRAPDSTLSAAINDIICDEETLITERD